MPNYDRESARPWNGYRYAAENLVISDSVTSIGNRAFSFFSNLKNVTIADSVTEIGTYAFSSCTSLTSLDIPVSVTRICYGAFMNCYKLSDVSIPPHAVIEEGAFSGTLLDAESTATAAATTEKVILGEFIEQQNVSMGRTCPFKLDTTARNQSGVILEHYIEYEGYFPFGTWYLYAKTEGGSWDHIAEFTITEDDIGKYVTYDLTFDKPETFDYLALCASRYAGEYSSTFDAIFYYK